MTHHGATRWLLFWLATVFAAATTAATDGLVFEIRRDGDFRGFLVGTMHSEDPRVTALARGLEPLVRRVDVVALEVVPDAASLVAVGAATLLPPGRSLRETVGQRRYAALETAAVTRGLPLALLDRMKPWAVAVMLGMPAPETGRFLDMVIYLAARDSGRRVSGLETIAEQLAVFDGMNETLQLALLDEVLAHADRLPALLEDLTQAYLRGDLALLDAVARAQYADSGPTVQAWFEDEVLNGRNARMSARLRRLLDDAAVLAAVGAMHLPGEAGLIALLRQAGYTVERRRPGAAR